MPGGSDGPDRGSQKRIGKWQRPKSTQVRAGKRRARKSAVEVGGAGRSGRLVGSRRRRETRERLLNAALKLMAERVMDGMAVNEITEAADVSFSLFSITFLPEEAIHAELMDLVFERFADSLERALACVGDPGGNHRGIGSAHALPGPQ